MSLETKWSLFTLSFLSATLLPGGSEAYVFYLIKNDAYFLQTIFIATIGNTLGGFTNYVIGRWGKQLLYSKWFGFDRRKLRKARFFFHKRGQFALFFAFLPIIGDPITAVAGVLEYSISKFFFWVFLGKMFRYTVIVYLSSWQI
ncbi:MAG: DedA family protein [Spirochaetia bacterium]|nr:DedA family protein [Spirochaetia bacterium]